MDIQWGWFIAAYCVIGIVMAYLCYSLAEHKYYANASTYAILGFLFGTLTLLFVAGLPDLKNRQLIDELKEEIEQLKKGINISDRKKNHLSGNDAKDNADYSGKPEVRDEGENSDAYRKAELEVLPEQQRQKIAREQTKPNQRKDSEKLEVADQLTFCYHCGSDLAGNSIKCPSCGKNL